MINTTTYSKRKSFKPYFAGRKYYCNMIIKFLKVTTEYCLIFLYFNTIFLDMF